jgi:hypothetical protein
VQFCHAVDKFCAAVSEITGKVVMDVQSFHVLIKLVPEPKSVGRKEFMEVQYNHV